MDFDLTEEQQMLIDVAEKFAKQFPREYMNQHMLDKTFPNELWEAMGKEGYIGITVPEEYGGAGMGQMEMMLFHERLGEYGITMMAAGLGPGFVMPCIVKNGDDYHKNTYLTPAVRGETKFCFGITETPDQGSCAAALLRTLF